MNRRVLAALTVVASCVLLVAVLFLARWDWSLTTDTMTVLVNDVDELDGAKCVWSGSQHFHVTLPEARAQFRIILFESEQQMSALIDARDVLEIQAESIQLRLVAIYPDGHREEVPVTPERHPLIERSADGDVRFWLQDFQVSGDLNALPEGCIHLQWSMDCRDNDGMIETISITVPLRKEEITVPSSIV